MRLKIFDPRRVECTSMYVARVLFDFLRRDQEIKKKKDDDVKISMLLIFTLKLNESHRKIDLDLLSIDMSKLLLS